MERPNVVYPAVREQLFIFTGRVTFSGSFPLPLLLPAVAYSAGSHYSLSAFHYPGAPGVLTAIYAPPPVPA